MEKKWTPGPWFPAGPGGEPDNGPVFFASVYAEDDTSELFYKICELPLEVFDEEQNANADLIAAAPELYDALEDCEYWLSAPPTSQPDRECVANVIKNARRIMAKARSENAKQETP